MLDGGVMQRSADSIVAERGHAFFAHGMNKRIDGSAERIDPKCFGHGKRAEICPISSGESAVGEVSAQKHDDDGDDECVDQNGEHTAERNAQNVVAEKFTHSPGSDSGGQRREGTDEHIVDPERGSNIAQHAAYVQCGDRFRKKQGKDRERFGGADLQKSVVSKRAERVGECNVQGGDDAGSAQHLSREFLHYSVYLGCF